MRIQQYINTLVLINLDITIIDLILRLLGNFYSHSKLLTFIRFFYFKNNYAILTNYKFFLIDNFARYLIKYYEIN